MGKPNKNNIVKRGKYFLKDEDKKKGGNSKKKEAEKMRLERIKKNKELLKRCNCDHIDAKKGKTYFDYSPDGMTKTCRICKGVLVADKNSITVETVKAADQLLYTLFGLARNKLALDETLDKQITNTLAMNAKSVELLEAIIETTSKSKKKKKKKKNRERYGSFERISY